ncbi:MAG: hypothetical protein ACRERE_34330 [Candidatus Entotheonellia bacterium]
MSGPVRNLAVESGAAGIQGGGNDQSVIEAVAVAGLDIDATLLLARNGLGGEWHLAYHEFMQLHLQARVIYVNAHNVP